MELISPRKDPINRTICIATAAGISDEKLSPSCEPVGKYGASACDMRNNACMLLSISPSRGTRRTCGCLICTLARWSESLLDVKGLESRQEGRALDRDNIHPKRLGITGVPKFKTEWPINTFELFFDFMRSACSHLTPPTRSDHRVGPHRSIFVMWQEELGNCQFVLGIAI